MDIVFLPILGWSQLGLKMKKKNKFDPARSGKTVKSIAPSIFLVVFFGSGVIANGIYEANFHSASDGPKSLLPSHDDFAILPDRNIQNIDVSSNSTHVEEDPVLIASPDLHPEVSFSVPQPYMIGISSVISFNRYEFKKLDVELNQNIANRTPNLYFSNQWLRDKLPNVDFGSEQSAVSNIADSRVPSLTSPSGKIISAPILPDMEKSTNLKFSIAMNAKSQQEAFFSFSGDVEFSNFKQDINSAANKVAHLSTALNENDIGIVNNSTEAISPKSDRKDKEKIAATVEKKPAKEEPNSQRKITRLSKVPNGKPNEEKIKEYTVIGVFVVGSKRWALIKNDAGQIRKYTIGERIGDYSVAAISDRKVRLANSFGEDVFVQAGHMF